MVLSIFDRTGKIKNEFISQGFPCKSLDMHPGYLNNKTDIQTNFLKWDYKQYKRDYFKFMFIALPCQTFSIASGALHFKNSIPQTPQAHEALQILHYLRVIVDYFNCEFVIENPAGGLVNNSTFNNLFTTYVTRLTLKNFGFPTQKKTDLFFSFNNLLLVPVTYRVNGRYQNQKLDNMSYNQKVNYPDHFVKFIVSHIIKSIF